MLLSFKAPTIETTFEGYLRSKSHARVDNLHIILKRKKQIVAEGVTDKNGHFELGFDGGLHDMEPLRLYYVTRKNDTVLLKKFSKLKEEVTKVSFSIP